jgi:hypothetical protein
MSDGKSGDQASVIAQEVERERLLGDAAQGDHELEVREQIDEPGQPWQAGSGLTTDSRAADGLGLSWNT